MKNNVCVLVAFAVALVLLVPLSSLANGDGQIWTDERDAEGSSSGNAESSDEQGSVGQSAPEGWVIECADCKTMGDLTDRSLALDASGQPHIVYGRDHLYHAFYDGSEWQYEVANCAPGDFTHTALAFDGNNYPHASFYDEGYGNLGYAYQDSSGWHIETVDSAGDVGQHTSIDVDGNNYPHISYFDATNYELKHAYKDATGWHIETVDSISDTNGIGFSTSLALDGSGYPHISYHDGSLSLNYAYQDASGWHIEDKIDFVSGLYSSIAVDVNGFPHISHHGFNTGDSDLRYTYKDSGGWHTEIVDSPPGAFDSTGEDTSIALDGNGYPHISYSASTANEFKYAYKDAGGWHLDTIQSGAPEMTSLAVDGSGTPQIGYDIGTLNYAERNGGGWQTQVLDEVISVGHYPSLALDSQGRPHISHRRDNGDPDGTDVIRYVYKEDGCWYVEEIDTIEWGTDPTSLALDGNDYPRIAYTSCTFLGGKPRYAYMDATGWHTETVVVMGEIGRYRDPSLALDGSDKPYIAYYYETPDHLDIALAERTASGWVTETVSVLGRRPSLALDETDTPHISYWRLYAQALRYATVGSSGWFSETVDGGGGVLAGMNNSIALDGSGYPHISYILEEDLMYAYKDASGWHTELVEEDLHVHWEHYTNSLVVDKNGYPHISYHRFKDSSEKESQLKYAYKDASGWHITVLDTNDIGLKIGQQSSIALDENGHVHIAYYGGGLKYAYQVTVQHAYLPLVTRQ
jgi:hypothetical protein